MLVDTHGHLNFNAYKKESKELFENTVKNSVAVVMPGSQIDTSRRAVKLAEEWDSPYAWAAVGLHPIHLAYTRPDQFEKDTGGILKVRPEEFDRDAYEELLKSPKTVAVGEIGLDYWRKPKTTAKKEAYIETQKEYFIKQLDMALDNKKPVILHCRVAHDDMLEIVKNHPISETKIPGIVHSYTGNAKQMRQFVDMGFYIAFNALIYILDFLPHVVENTRLERMVLETDSPYLLPPQEKEKGSKRNTPLSVKYVAEKVAEIKGVDISEVEKHTTANAETVFGVDFS
ncbi:MAG: TatD family hydrolase [Candidatus Spechtbacterales bacterium]|nr:TatD family hydrolase [Candidatus Spechtbacterales bacterium]